MDQTTCLGIPYPECDPPRVKDAADIEQFRDTALGVDAAVQQLNDAVTEYLVSPDACVMSGGLTAAGRDLDLPLTVSVYDNASMASVTDTRIRIASDGWYLIGGWVRATGGATVDPGGVGMRIQPTLNGDPVSNRQGPGRPTLGGASTTDDVGLNPITMSLSTGDLLGLRSHHAASAALSVTYAHQLWAVRILANV